MFTNFRKTLFVVLFCLCGSSASALEHPVSVIKAKAFIGTDRMTVSYEVVYADDLELFHGLEAKESGFYDEDELDDAIEKHGKFLDEHVKIVDSDGNALPSNLLNIIDIEIPEGGLPAGSLMQYSLVYTFVYKFKKEKPKFLTFQHLIDDSEIPNPVEIDITLKQTGAKPPYPRFGLRFNQPETRNFKWSDVTKNASQKDIDDWLSKELEPDQVGIEGYSSSYSFIYITDYEVRHELLIPLATLATMIDFERADKSFLTIEEQDNARPKIEALLSEGNPVLIDGVTVQPVIDRIDFYGLDTMDFATRAPRRTVSMINGRVGIILSYSTKGTPDEVTVKWETFNDALKVIDAVGIAFEEVTKFKFARYKTAEFKEKDENIFVWKNPGRSTDPPPEPVSTFQEAFQKQKQFQRYSVIGGGVLSALVFLTMFFAPAKRIKWVAAIVVGLGLVWITLMLIPTTFQSITKKVGLRPELSENDAAQVFEKIHKNMFRAFDYHHEEDVYDALQASIDGPLLSTTYQNIRKSLAMQTQGGAISHIDEVQYEGGQKSDPIPGESLAYPGFAFRCQWNLVGSVEHWAHVHQRTIKYDAIFHVENVDGNWKITQQRIVDESAGKVKQWRRKLTPTKKKQPSQG